MYSAAESGQYGAQYPESGYEGEGYGGSFGAKAVRLAFIRKVYGILSCQLLVTFGFICVFAIPEPMRQWSHQNLWILWVAFIVAFVTMLVLACCGEMRRQTPHNYIALSIFTFAESFLLGIISSIYPMEVVLIAVGITTIICLALTAFAFQTKIDFTIFSGLLFVFLVVLSIFGLVLMFWRSEVAHLIYACLGALLFAAYLVVDTQMIIGGNHKLTISEEEYVFAALTLYLDMINIFIYLLQIISYFSSD